MRRSICYCDPNMALAGQIDTWNFIYTTATTLPKGARLRFDLNCKGREIDWEQPNTNLKKGSNVIYAYIGENGKPIQAKEVETPNSLIPLYDFILPKEVEAGDTITIVIGAPKGKEDKPEKGNGAQLNAQRRRPFYLYIDPKGKENFDDPEIFSMDVKGNVLDNIRIIAPSFVARNHRFDVVLRFEDEYGNLTSNADEDTLVELSYENLRENLSWKLFVPETGFLTLPNLYFNEEGIYRIQIKNLKTGDLFLSSPIRCFSNNDKHLFWGLLHGEFDRFDAEENIENCLRYIRDDQALDFFASSPFESQEETPNDTWKLITQNIAEFNEDERFITFLGFQWVGEPGKEGVRQLIYTKDNKQILRKKEAKNNSLKKIYKNLTPKDLIAIPSFTMAKGYHFDFKNHDPEFERVVEIYNSWGCSEMTKKEGNEYPISSKGRTGVKETAEGSIQKALNEGCRLGFVAGGLDDRGIYAPLFDSSQEQYFPGLTAVAAKDLSRQSLLDALYRRSCFATTGERMILDFTIAGVPMGVVTNTQEKPGLMMNRHIRGFAAGTAKLTKVELIRNGKVLTTLKPDKGTDTQDGRSLEFVFDDMEPLNKTALKPKPKEPPFVYYYLRITQEDGHKAWSSPIWIEILDQKDKSKTKNKTGKR